MDGSNKNQLFLLLFYLREVQVLVLDEQLHEYLRYGDDGDGQDGCHGDDPADGVGPLRVGVGALGQGLVARPGYDQDDLTGKKAVNYFGFFCTGM